MALTKEEKLALNKDLRELISCSRPLSKKRQPTYKELTDQAKDRTIVMVTRFWDEEAASWLLNSRVVASELILMFADEALCPEFIGYFALPEGIVTIDDWRNDPHYR